MQLQSRLLSGGLKHTRQIPRVDLKLHARPLKDILSKAQSGRLFAQAPFAGIRNSLQKVKDIASSSNGEPTTCPQFKEAVEPAVSAKQESGLPDLRVVVITNAIMVHRAKVAQALSILNRDNGEIWGKLDAGTERYCKQVDVAMIPVDRILGNVFDTAQLRPIVIQTFFMRVHGARPIDAEIRAYYTMFTRNHRPRRPVRCSIAQRPGPSS